MRRWNGWGEESITYPISESSLKFLQQQIGQGIPIQDVTLESAIQAVPATKLQSHPLIKADPLDRLLHARGQSLPDWVALNAGRIGTFPDGVAYPENTEEVRILLELAERGSFQVIPYGGGTSVVGHINPLESHVPVLTIDLSQMNQLHELDETSRLATFGAGANGPCLEGQLNALGFTLGHFPQSFELSTLGGWIASRSSGQQSYYYGRIEDLFAGGFVETPIGTLALPVYPASAAGSDLKQTILGSEGRLGIITQASVKVRPLPEVEKFYSIFFQSWESGVESVRQISQNKVPISMARLSDPMETEITMQLSGKDELVKWADLGLNILNFSTGRSLLIFGVTGDRQNARLARRHVLSIALGQGGLFTGTVIGKLWKKSRFFTPYLRNTLWKLGYAVDTLETALPWSKVLPAAKEINKAIKEGLNPFEEQALVFAHLSHIYLDGASIYVTYIFRRSEDPDETLQRWQVLKASASQAIVNSGGTISHQHGVGSDHAMYLEAEKGPVGMTLLRETAKALDPNGMLNPGKLWV